MVKASCAGGGYDGLIVDLDGVVWLGGEPIPGSVEAIRQLRARGVRVLFLTNDPQGTRAEHAARLTSVGIPTTPDQVLTSAAAIGMFLANQPEVRGGSVLVIGAAALHQEIREAGFRVVPPADARQADLVVVGGHPGFDYTELCAATTAIRNGAKLVATGRDPVFPSPDGPRPATGAILAAIETAAGVRATVIGKPEPYVFTLAREALSGCTRLAAVGDNLAADIAGAQRSGLDAVLVLTGNTTEGDLAGSDIQPDLVLANLASLAGPISQAGQAATPRVPGVDHYPGAGLRGRRLA